MAYKLLPSSTYKPLKLGGPIGRAAARGRARGGGGKAAKDMTSTAAFWENAIRFGMGMSEAIIDLGLNYARDALDRGQNRQSKVDPETGETEVVPTDEDLERAYGDLLGNVPDIHPVWAGMARSYSRLPPKKSSVQRQLERVSVARQAGADWQSSIRPGAPQAIRGAPGVGGLRQAEAQVRAAPVGVPYKRPARVRQPLPTIPARGIGGLRRMEATVRSPSAFARAGSAIARWFGGPGRYASPSMPGNLFGVRRP